jgi:phosphonate ABC transporter permease subunit PhnE
MSGPAKRSSLWKSLRTGLLTALVILVFAYGFKITKVNLTELRSEKRQESLTRVIRTLAKPDLFAYRQEEVVATAPLYLPCPDASTLDALPAPDTSGPYMVITPSCAEPEGTVQVEGFNFFSNAKGPLRFVPGSDPANTVSLGNDIATTDSEGYFLATMTLPDRPSEDVQYLRATIRRNLGVLPELTDTAYSTWDKIVETVFLALLATAIGTVLAIPLSFLAARNLMVSVRSPLASISLSILGWPAGIALGYLAASWIADLSAAVATNLLATVVGFVLATLAAWQALRWALPQEEPVPPSSARRAGRALLMLLAAGLALFALYELAALAMNLGARFEQILASFGFLGGFLFQIGEILRLLTPALAALAGGGVLSGRLARLGQHFAERASTGAVKAFNLVVAAAAGATLMGLLGWMIDLLYEIGEQSFTLWIPMAVGAIAGLVLAALVKPKDTLPDGLVIYTITRTILNFTRSIEALVMAIVFVIAVGIGPFAGVLALGLHTIVSLGKLYSEQVESILPGPLEAVEATGANRLQTIIYAVVPQIVPPFISYTMYRWDINVRMSTIIGFVGGGGIGFLLQQNINLLNYRAAAAQMLAIAVVVAGMDYISSYLRQRVV